ncbi:MAG: hypothetical protein J7647_30560 [Cyanobacteria bacterium SBLK]|nr:hypothetical protein [Cyanobacteria bacterium SBLK]
MSNSSQNEKENRSIAIGDNEIKGSAYIEELKGSGYTEGNTYYIEKIVLPAIAASGF